MQTRQRNLTLISWIVLFICVLFLLSAKTQAAETGTVPVTAKIPVSCTGGNPLETLTFVMEMETRELQKPEQLMIRMKAGEEGAFTIHYVYPGTYHYSIHQEAGSESKTTYDSTVYEVDVYVTEDEKGVLFAEPVVYTQGSSEKTAKIDFKNTAESNPSKSSRVSAVQTGDSTQPMVYVTLFLISVIGAAVLGKYFWKSKGGKQR